MRPFLPFLALALCFGTSASWAASTFYAMDDRSNSLYIIDPHTYALTFVGFTGVNVGDFGDLAYDPGSGTTYWAAGRGDDNLYAINLSTGAATLVGSHGINDLFALAFDPATGKLYGDSADGNFYSLNTTTGAATLIGSNGIYPGGMTYRADTGQLVMNEPLNGTFYSINPATGTATPLGIAGFINDNGLAWDPGNGLYLIDTWSDNLITIDPTTFTQTVVSGLADPFDGLIYVGGKVVTPSPEHFC